MAAPTIQIDLAKIRHNAQVLVQRLEAKGIAVAGVTKAALGSPEIAKVMLSAGVQSIGDSRIENIQRMREAGVDARFLLLRAPQLSRVADVVQHVDVSCNSEMEVIAALSRVAQATSRKHQIVLMVELGDLREGILPEDLEEHVRQCLQLPGIELVGLGCNLACLGGVIPDAGKMQELSDLARAMEARFDLRFEIVSGGNSANLAWVFGSTDMGRINHLRLGESIFLGCETLHRSAIEGLHTDAIVLRAEVIEAKTKPSVPWGKMAQDAFGERPVLREGGLMHRAILGIGRQDVAVPGLMPLDAGLQILGASSDHLVVASEDRPLRVGDEVSFRLNYAALLRAMTSPYLEKIYLNPV